MRQTTAIFILIIISCALLSALGTMIVTGVVPARSTDHISAKETFIGLFGVATGLTLALTFWVLFTDWRDR